MGPSSAAFLAGHRRQRAWRQVAHGLYVPQPAAHEAELWALASALHRGGGFSHLTGAALRGWWTPPLPAGLPAFAAQNNRNRPRRPELRIMRTTPVPTLTPIRGLPVVGPEDVLLACSRHLELLDVIVLAESAIVLGDTTRPRLDLAVLARRFGVRRLRLALPFVNGRAESTQEVLLRTLLELCSVALEVQYDLWSGGRFVARGDLRIVGTTTFMEYDGSGHRSPRQHQLDLRRDRDIATAGWTRRGYTLTDLLHRPHVILRDADHALGRPHLPGRLEPWLDLLRESCWTASGRELLLRRLDLPTP